jgi:hypothetical protein
VRVTLAASLLAVVLAACSVAVNPPDASAGVLDASWTEPTTNVDGTDLVDLASYRVYIAVSPGVPCPGGNFIVVAAPLPNPAPNSTVAKHLTGLAVGKNYTVAVTAVNVDGSESACSATASANARPATPNAPNGPKLN